MDRRLACPASYRLEQDKPAESSKEADAGTEKHDVMKDLISSPKDRVFEIFEQLSTGDQETCEQISFCWEFFQRLPQDWTVLTEKKLDCRYIHQAIGYGTADLILVQPFSKVVVVDWKFGRIPVKPAPDNIQLACYALAAAKEFECPQAYVYICQAPLMRITDHCYTDLEALAFNVRMVVESCLKPDAPAIPSEDGCRYCKARGDCPAARALNAELAAIPTAVLDQLSSAQFSHLLDQCEKADGFIGKVKQAAYAKALSGSPPTGWELRPGKRSRSWNLEDAKLEKALRELAEAKGQIADSVYSEKKVSTPAQLEERFKNVDGWKDDLAKLWSWKEGAQVLDRKKEKKK